MEKPEALLLFFQVTGVLLFCVYGIHSLLAGFHWFLGFAWHVFLAFSFIALKDLVLHSNRISTAVESGDLKMARHHCSMLMGRDVSRLDGKGCNRAGIESVSESLVDGVLSPLFWLFFTGIYGMLIFKIISTMDSMVGYKNEKYLHFGWFGARSDDLFNYIPARLSWILIGLTAWLLPGFSAPKALSVGLKYHSHVPGPNAGWSEAACAGALGVRIVGPIYREGKLVTDLWIGAETDPEAGSTKDVVRMNRLARVTTLLTVAIPTVLLFF